MEVPSADPAAHDALRDVVRACPWLMRVLRTVRDVGADCGLGCWVGAGAVRDLVWDVRFGPGGPRDPASFDGSVVADIDVVWFDVDRVGAAHEHAVEEELAARRPELVWDATNQAGVHLWYTRRFGTPVVPLRSVTDGVATWPETATAVAVALGDRGSIDVCAPLGLDDLLTGVLRHNPRRADAAAFRDRVMRKRVPTRWPGVRVVW